MGLGGGEEAGAGGAFSSPGLVVLALTAASGVALAGAGGAFSSPGLVPNRQCAAPRLAGTVVDVQHT